jgi:hypothetical protein
MTLYVGSLCACLPAPEARRFLANVPRRTTSRLAPERRSLPLLLPCRKTEDRSYQYRYGSRNGEPASGHLGALGDQSRKHGDDCADGHRQEPRFAEATRRREDRAAGRKEQAEDSEPEQMEDHEEGAERGDEQADLSEALRTGLARRGSLRRLDRALHEAKL